MFKIKFVVGDIDYGEKLIYAFQRQFSNCMSVEMIQVNALTNIVLQPNVWDLWVIDKNVIDDREFLNEAGIEYVILVEDYKVDQEVVYQCVSKYQSIEMMGQKLMDYLTNSEDKKYISLSDKKGKIVNVYSPLGGSGKTTMAILLAKQAIKHYSKVLYLSIEPTQSTSLFFYSSNTYKVTDLFYYQAMNRLQDKLEIITSRDEKTGIQFLQPEVYKNDLAICSKSEWREILVALREKYEMIFIDHCSKLDEEVGANLEDSDLNILLTCQDEVSDVKFKNFYYNYYKKNHIEKNTYIFSNQRSNARGNQLYKQPIEGLKTFEIPFVENLLCRVDGLYEHKISKQLSEMFYEVIKEGV